jgi:predicted HNH restriction endonuclease
MDPNVARIIASLKSFDDLSQFETNARSRDALDQDVEHALNERAAVLGRSVVAQATGLDLNRLSPAEKEIVRAAAIYAGIKKRKGTNANRMFGQFRRIGLIQAAERSVMKSQPTIGFETLAAENLDALSYEKIIVDHPEEFSERALWYARKRLGLANDSERPRAETKRTVQPMPGTTQRNPAWTRDELILALDLYLSSRESPFSKTSSEVAEISHFLGLMAHASGRSESTTFRNADGIYMKMMNFRRFDPKYVGGGKVGLERGNSLEGPLWSEFADDPRALASAVANIRARIQPAPFAGVPYWTFVCNPRKWAIDSFLEKQIEHDTWGIRPSDQARFAPGQLGLVRVGVDRRSIEERSGKPPLEAGIYAVCEVESEVFSGTGANDEHWADGASREPGWPTVRIRYVRTYLGKPLTIESLRTQAPELSPLILNGFQAASFPISTEDFHRIIDLLDEDIVEIVTQGSVQDEANNDLAALEEKYRGASPEVKERVSKYVERGAIGNRVKKALKHRCQICTALGRDPIAFKKKNGELYAEAHHVMPIAKLKTGSLGPSNIMVVCANHHRQLHYGGVSVIIKDKTFEMRIDEIEVSIERYLKEDLR